MDDFFDSKTVSSCSVSATMDGGEKTMLLSPTNDLLCTQYKPPPSFSPAFSSFLHPSPDS